MTVLAIGGLFPGQGFLAASGNQSVVPEMKEFRITPEVDRLIRDGCEAMYRFDIHTAELHFENLIRMFPEHPIGYMYRAELVWWLALLDTANKSFQDNFNSFTEVAIKKGQALLAKNADDFYANLYTASAYGNKTRFCVTVTDQTLGAVRAAMAGNKYNRKALALRPDYKDCLLGIGAWDYFTGDLPALIKPFAWLLGARGDKEKGLAALREAAEKGEYAKIETRMVLLGVYLTRKEFNTYLELLRNLIRQYPSNPVFYFWMGRYFSQHELWEDGRQAFLSLLNGKPAGSHSQPEAWLFLGLARMEMGKRDPDSAMEHLGKALEYNRNDLNLQVRAHLYRGCCYDTKGNRPAAVAEYQQVKKLPPVETLHKDADRYLKRPFRW